MILPPQLIDLWDRIAPAPEDEESVEMTLQAKWRATAPQPLTYQRLTCQELDAGNYDHEYLIERTLVRGQPCIVAGPKKALKTTFIIALAIALAMGVAFLGRLAVGRRCRVVIMSGESGLSTLQETARRVAKSHGLQLAEIENLIWSTSLPKFGDPRHLDALDRFLRETQAEVLILDPCYLCMPSADAGNLFAQGELLAQMNQVCEAAGVTLILCHHTRKAGRPDQYEPLELDHLAWAGFAEFARQWVLIGRREKYRPGSGEHHMWLTTGGSAGHSALWAVDVHEGAFDGETPRQWVVTLAKPSEVREEEQEQKQEAKVQAAKDKLLATLRKGPETLTGLKDLTNIKAAIARAALDELKAEGLVADCQVRKGKTNYSAFQLKEQT